MVKNKLLIPLICLTLVFLITSTTNITNNSYLIANRNNIIQDSEISILDWEVNGIGICTDISIQEIPQICSDGVGGAIITWQDYRNALSALDIYTQRVNGSGIVNWTADGVGVCTATSEQGYPQICSDGMGGAIIVWRDYRSGSQYDIYAQKINSTGNVQWTANGVAICSEGHEQYFPQICSDGTGGAIIAWWDYRSTKNWDIYAQRINSTGIVNWTASGVAVCTENNSQDLPYICSDGSGGAIIAWDDYRKNFPYSDIYIQKINATGMPQWDNNGTAICTLDYNQQYPRVCSDGAGGAIVTWEDYRGVTSGNIYAQKISSIGNVQWIDNGTGICTAPDVQAFPEICSDSAGGAIITWQDWRDASATDYDIYAQNIGPAGANYWTNNGEAICKATGEQRAPRICNDTEGGAIITWYDYRSGSDYDVYAQRVNSSGSINWTNNGIAVCTASGDQLFQQICSNGSVGAIIVWRDQRTGASDIYAQKELTTFTSASDNSGLAVLLIMTMQQPQTMGITITIVVVVITAVVVTVVVFYLKKK